MGAWGPAIFSDDFALDIKEEFKEKIGDGLSAKEATNSLIKEFSEELSDEFEAPVFWVALAATQHQIGHIEQSVIEKAISIIDSKVDLVKWEHDKPNKKKREIALNKLRDKLKTPPPSPKKIPKTIKTNTPFSTGDVFQFTFNNQLALIRLIGHHIDKGGKYPVCELLDWDGDTLPYKKKWFSKKRVLNTSSLTHLPYRILQQDGHKIHKFMLGSKGAKGRDIAKKASLIFKGSIPDQTCSQYSVCFWEDLEQSLITTFKK